MPSFLVTLTSANTNYSLRTLVRAIDADFVDQGREIVIQADNANAGTVLLGHETSLSATRYGYSLDAGASNVYTVSAGKHHLGGLTARSSTAGQKLAIDVVR